jgi:hypothetical protein
MDHMQIYGFIPANSTYGINKYHGSDKNEYCFSLFLIVRPFPHKNGKQAAGTASGSQYA